MISKTTQVVNNEFQVTFDFTPDNIYHSRTNSKGTYWSTHVANGTTSRRGIWEGIEIVEVWTQIGNNAWRSHGTSSRVTVSTRDNNVTIKAQARYRLRTMGYHWNDFSGTYPFFWFGNISKNPNKYRKGYFTDTYPASPGNEHHCCVVPPDWSYKWCEWSDWAYNHALATKNEAIYDGRYEKRNGNYESAKASNGWISDSGNGQMWRKSMMFYFEKDYYDSVTSSGISTHPNTPGLNVHWAKGDSGQVTVTYTDSAGIAGKIWLNAYCGNKTAQVLNWDTSWTFYNGQSSTINVDFNNAFGEECRGNDVYYEAWSRNNLGYECKNSSGWIGIQRYNGRPTKPSNLNLSGVNGIIYDKISINWHWGWDPDGDWIVYDLWARVVSKEGRVLKDDYIARGFNGLTMEYDISNYPEECNIQIWVRSSDNLIVSDWCDPVSCTKGYRPKGNITLLSPNVSGTNLYNKRPRFVFEGYDGSSEFIVVINDTEFSSWHHSYLFHHHHNRMVFKPNFDLNGHIKCYSYMKNQYGNGNMSVAHYFTIKHTYKDVVEGKYITAKSIKDIQLLIADFGKAFNRSFAYEIVDKEVIITARIYNTCHNFINSVLWDINNLTPGSPFEYALHCWPVEVGQLNDDELWNKLVQELNNI